MDTGSGASARAAAAYEALFEQAPVAMIAVSPERTIRLNWAALELFGRSQEEMSAWAFKPGAPWIPPDQNEHWEELRRRVAAGEAISGFRFKLARPSGELRDAELAAIPTTFPDGSPAGSITVITDHTERLSLESQLRHSQKMEALGRLAGGIAHDFNNVLMGIRGYAEFVLEDARSGTVEVGDAEQVVAATRRAIDLAGRLTAFARRDTPAPRSSTSGRTIEDITPLLRRLLPETIEIQSSIAPDLFVLVDRSDLEQSLMNLAVNAIDAMTGGGRLVIEVEGVDLDDDYATTHIGAKPGPARDDLDQRQRLGDGRCDQGADVRAVLHDEAGRRGHRARAGDGLRRRRARGWTDLGVFGAGPRDDLQDLPPARESGVEGDEPPGADELMPGGTESILVVEDDELVRDVVERTLRRLGYDVTVAALPEEALELAAARRYDALVTDVVMPGLTGDEVASQIRATQPDLPVVFMSGYTSSVLDLKLGSRDAFTPKPVSAGRLARAVREVLDRARSAGAR